MQQVQPQTNASLLEAIAAASNAFGDLTKDSKNDYLKSSYLALPALLKAIKQPLLEQGVVIYTQLVVEIGAIPVVRTTLSSLNGEEEVSSDFPVVDTSNVQKIGAAVTYGTRYNLLAMLAISPENDDDGNAASFGGGASSAPHALPGMGAPAPAPAPMAPPQAIAYPVQPAQVLPY